MQRKGQAAMEFLMTYGWAILAAIIAIGVLAYFGVFSPGKFTPSATVVNPPFYANAWAISTTAVSLELQNNGGEVYNITSVVLSNVNGATSCTTNDTVGQINASQLRTAIMPCSGMSAAGETFKADVTITYTKAGSALALTSTGTVAGNIA